VRRGQIARIERGETAVPQSSLPSEVETVVSVLTEQKTARSVVATAGDDAPSGSRRLPFPQAVAWGLGVTALAASLLASRALVQGDPAGAPAMSRAVAASAQAPARTESAVRASAAPDPPRDPVTAPVTSVPLSKPASSTASAPRATHVVGPSRPPSPQPRPSFSSAASASSSSSASASPPCRLAELPDQDGILHPRMICP
jgi:hypothetical protein